MPACARCASIYFAALIGTLIYPLIKKEIIPENKKTPRNKYIILAIIPLAVDGLTQLAGLRESSNSIRIVTGFLAGLVIIWYIIPGVIELFEINNKKIK